MVGNGAEATKGNQKMRGKALQERAHREGG